MPRSATIIVLKVWTILSLILLLLWPAIYNTQPLFSPDTSAYIRGFDAGVVWLSGRTSEWTTWASKLTVLQAHAGHHPEAEVEGLQGPAFIIAGRSISYGALLYFGEVWGGMWASITVQAVGALGAVTLTLRHFGLFSFTKLALTVVTLSLLSSLPFFTSFLLPDVFAGLALLGAASLLALGHRLTRSEQFVWVLIVAAAVVFHPTHLIMIIALIIGAVLALIFRYNVSSVGIVALIFSAGIGVASEFAFSQAIEKVLGVQISRPPVLMARMIAHGAGTSFLKEKCPEAGMVVCEFADRLTSNSDAFLWDTSPATGIYRPASIENRRRLGNEQFRFAVAVLAHDPLGQIAASIQDTYQQFMMVGLTTFRSAADQAHPSL